MYLYPVFCCLSFFFLSASSHVPRRGKTIFSFLRFLVQYFRIDLLSSPIFLRFENRRIDPIYAEGQRDRKRSRKCIECKKVTPTKYACMVWLIVIGLQQRTGRKASNNLGIPRFFRSQKPTEAKKEKEKAPAQIEVIHRAISSP